MLLIHSYFLDLVMGVTSTGDDVEKRISKISGYVSEALWRRKLISGLDYDTMTNGKLTHILTIFRLFFRHFDLGV